MTGHFRSLLKNLFSSLWQQTRRAVFYILLILKHWLKYVVGELVKAGTWQGKFEKIWLFVKKFWLTLFLHYTATKLLINNIHNATLKKLPQRYHALFLHAKLCLFRYSVVRKYQTPLQFIFAFTKSIKAKYSLIKLSYQHLLCIIAECTIPNGQQYGVDSVVLCAAGCSSRDWETCRDTRTSAWHQIQANENLTQSASEPAIRAVMFQQDNKYKLTANL